jgi:hypothetical protein
MATDIRVLTHFRHNRKRRRLKRALGADGVLALLDLWLYAAERHTDGHLSGLTDEDIADECDWPGDPAEFVGALVKAGFLDGDPGEYVLHDWIENQPWVANADARSAAAKKAIHERWARKGACRGGTPHCDERCQQKQTDIRGEYDSNTDRIGAVSIRNTPLPSPSPSPPPSPAEPATDAQTATNAAGGGCLDNDAHNTGTDEPQEPEPPPTRRAEPNAGRSINAPQKHREPPAAPRSQPSPSISLDGLRNMDEVPPGEIARSMAAHGWECRLTRDGDLPKRLHDICPIAAWEWRKALASGLTTSMRSPISYLSGAVRGIRGRGEKPPEEPMTVDTIAQQSTRLARQWFDLCAQCGMPTPDATRMEQLVLLGSPVASDRDALVAAAGDWARYDARQDSAARDGIDAFWAMAGGRR